MDSLFFSVASIFISCLFYASHSNRCEMISHCGFDLLSLMISNVEHLFMYLLPFVCVFFGKLPISFSLLKKSNLFCCWVVCILPIFCTLKGRWMSLSHVQHFINPKLLLNIWFVNIFSDPEGCHFFFHLFCCAETF